MMIKAVIFQCLYYKRTKLFRLNEVEYLPELGSEVPASHPVGRQIGCW